MTPEEFIKENESHFGRICYERTAEEQSDDFINKVGMVCHLLETYAKHENAELKEANDIMQDKCIRIEHYEALQKDLEIAQRGLVELTNKAEQYWDEKVALQKQVEVMSSLLAQSSDISCDGCGNHSNIIYSTGAGRFCQFCYDKLNKH